MKSPELSGETTSVSDDVDLALVEKQAVSLADLYRRGKAKGLLSKRRDYP